MEKLFTPFQTGDTDLVNRVVMAPMTRSRAMTSDTADELTAKYYQLRESVWVMTDSDVWIKRGTRKQPGICGNKRKEALHGAA